MLIGKTNELFHVPCFYTGAKMNVLFDFYGITVMAHQQHVPADQMLQVSVKGEWSLLYQLHNFDD